MSSLSSCKLRISSHSMISLCLPKLLRIAWITWMHVNQKMQDYLLFAREVNSQMIRLTQEHMILCCKSWSWISKRSIFLRLWTSGSSMIMSINCMNSRRIFSMNLIFTFWSKNTTKKALIRQEYRKILSEQKKENKNISAILYP